MPTNTSAPCRSRPPSPPFASPAVTLWSLVSVFLLLAIPVEAQHVDPRSDEAIRWHTSMTDTVDDQRARELLLEALERLTSQR